MKVSIQELVEKILEKNEKGCNIIRDEKVYINDVLKDNPNEFFLILPELATTYNKYKSDIFQKFFVQGVYELGVMACGLHFNFEYTLLFLSKRKPQKVNFFFSYNIDENGCLIKDRVFYSPWCINLDEQDRKFLEEKYRPIFESLGHWIETDIVPDNIKNQINTIPYKEFDVSRLYDPRFFSKENCGLRKTFKSKVRLKDVAELVCVSDRPLNKTKCQPYKINKVSDINEQKINGKYVTKHDWIIDLSKHLKQTTFYNPLNLEIEVVGGDILADFWRSCYGFFSLVTDDGNAEHPIYLVHQMVWRIRTKSPLVTPEYLCLFLNSDLVRRWMEAFLDPRNISIETLKDIPVLLPRSSVPMAQNEVLKNYYIEILKKQSGSPTSNARISYYGTLKTLQKNATRVDLIGEEYRTKFITQYETDVRNWISNDFTELKKNIENGCYKSAAAMSGAILEVFLIDWCSALDGIDYFVTPYKKAKKRSDDKYLSLNDAINRINKKMSHKWVSFELANSIRDLRNQAMHPIVSFRSENHLGEKESQLIQDYLKKIILSRGKDFLDF